jgi:hypothetical protein
MGGGTLGQGFKAGVQSGLPDAVRASQAAAANQAIVQSNNALLPPPIAPAGSLTVAPPGSPGFTPSGPVPVPAEYAGIPSVTATAPAPAQAASVSTQLSGDLVFPSGTTTPGQDAYSLATAGPPKAVVPGQDAYSLATAGPPKAVASEAALAQGAGPKALTAEQLTELQTPSFGSSVKDMFNFGEGKSFLQAGKDAFLPGKVKPIDWVRKTLGLEETAGREALNAAVEGSGKSLGEWLKEAVVNIEAEGLNPGFLRTYAPSVGAGILGLTAAGGFAAPEVEENAVDPFGMDGKTGFDLLEENPQQYRIFSQGAPYQVPRVGTVANGGTIDHFPRRDGSITGPGTGTSDDIPAMLSDGEFVMTAQAVRGAGNGDRRQGVKRMYDVMRSFEGAA